MSLQHKIVTVTEEGYKSGDEMQGINSDFYEEEEQSLGCSTDVVPVAS